MRVQHFSRTRGGISVISEISEISESSESSESSERGRVGEGRVGVSRDC